MTARTCASCSLPVKDQDTICRDCRRATSRRLANQTWYAEQLTLELARMTRKLAETEGGRVTIATTWAQAGELFLIDITADMIRTWDQRARGAAEALHTQRHILVAWVKLLTDERYLKALPADTIPALAAAVESQLQAFKAHAAAGELVDEFRNLDSRIGQLIDLPQYRMRQHAGPCPQKYADVEGREDWCPGQVEMVVPADETVSSWLECLACKKRWDPTQFARAGDLILRREAQLKEAERMASRWRKVAL